MTGERYTVAMWKVLFLFVLVGGGYAEAQISLSNITNNLRQGMSSVMEMSVVTYSEPSVNAVYVSKLEFDMRAMGHLYNTSYVVIDAIVKKQAYPEGVVSVQDGNLELTKPLREHWRLLLSHYPGPAAVTVLVALLVVVLPLAGLFWCCCQWCRLGRRRRPVDRKYDGCFKGILAIGLIALLTLFLFGVVCAFVTEAQLEKGMDEGPRALRAGMADARSFLNATQAHARYLLVDNYNELASQLNSMLDLGGGVVLRQLDEYTNATSAQQLDAMLRRLQRVPQDLQVVHEHTMQLQAMASTLDDELRKVKDLLLQTVMRCQESACDRLKEKYNFNQLHIEIPYSKIPNVTALKNNVTKLLETELPNVRAGLQVFDGIKKTVDQHVPLVRGAISDAGGQLLHMANSITWAAGNASEKLRSVEAATESLDRLLQYEPYRAYVSRATAACLLAIVCLMALGLLCGVCGKRPDVYGASDCCNKGSGSTCLLCGMCLIFVVGGAVAVVMLAYFLAGVGAQRFVCDPLNEPRGNRVFEDAQKFVDGSEYAVVHVNYSKFLVDCHQNHTFYQILKNQGMLQRLLGQDTEQLSGQGPEQEPGLERLRASVTASLRQRAAAVRTDYPPRDRPLLLLPPAARDTLRRLASCGLSDFNWDTILDALATNLTSLDLVGLEQQLRLKSRELQPRPAFRGVAADLATAADSLRRLQIETVQPMQERVAALDAAASELRDSLRFNHSSLRDAVQQRMLDALEVEAFLNTMGPGLLQNLTRDFVEAVTGRMVQYMGRLEDAAAERVGRCGALSGVLNNTRDAACRAVVLPANGFWMSLSWCVLLFLPLLLVAQRLSRLYRHVNPYPGPLVEAEYLYDAYADRDNVPLANAYKAEKRAGREASGGGGSGAGRAQAPAMAPSGDAHHARRYNDMAPKHWEEPPRYHGPTEYERPPPYYYPGPTDRQ